DGAFTSGDPCGSLHVYPARDGLTEAVGVVDSLPEAEDGTGAAWWILDDARPSTLRIGDGAAIETRLARLAIPIAAGSASLSYVQPSERTGEKLPTDPVEGAASLHELTLPKTTSGAGGAPTGSAAECAGGAGGGGGGAAGTGGAAAGLGGAS